MSKSILTSSIPTRILLHLLEIGEGLVREVLLAPLKVDRMYAGAARRRANMQAGRQALYRLKQLKYVERRGNLRHATYRLTPSGQQQAHQLLTLLTETLPPVAVPQKKWDGVWRIVCFDIPEIKRRERAYWRIFLKQSGFKKYQDSVWITPYNILPQIISIAKDAGLVKYVRTITATRIDDANIFKHVFNV